MKKKLTLYPHTTFPKQCTVAARDLDLTFACACLESILSSPLLKNETFFNVNSVKMESRSCQNTPLRKNGDDNESGLRKRRNSAPELELKSIKSNRPSYVVPTKAKIRHRSRRVSNTNGAGGSHSRALSPINYKVREYLARADEKIEDYLERIVQNVHVKAENAQVMVQSLAQKLRNWKACHFEKLPSWMRDNDFLHFGHRPELPSFAECFRSIFRIHTETGNIWTHLIGFVAFVIATIVFYVKPFCDICSLDIEVRII